MTDEASVQCIWKGKSRVIERERGGKERKKQQRWRIKEKGDNREQTDG